MQMTNGMETKGLISDFVLGMIQRSGKEDLLMALEIMGAMLDSGAVSDALIRQVCMVLRESRDSGGELCFPWRTALLFRMVGLAVGAGVGEELAGLVVDALAHEFWRAKEYGDPTLPEVVLPLVVKDSELATKLLASDLWAELIRRLGLASFEASWPRLLRVMAEGLSRAPEDLRMVAAGAVPLAPMLNGLRHSELDSDALDLLAWAQLYAAADVSWLGLAERDLRRHALTQEGG
jgi:hypothetical protein